MDWHTSSYCNGGACVEVASWRTSSRSAGNGACVQVATLDEAVVAVRDSKNPDGAVLAFTPDAWRDLTSRVKDGDG